MNYGENRAARQTCGRYFMYGDVYYTANSKYFMYGDVYYTVNSKYVMYGTIHVSAYLYTAHMDSSGYW